MLRIALIASLLLASTQAHGQEPWRDGVADESADAALELYQQGNVFFDESRYAEALAEYRRALEHWDHPKIRFNGGICLVHLEQPIEALAYFESALRYDGAAISRDSAQRARTYLALLAKQLADISIESPQRGVEVTLDGQPLLTGPDKIRRKVLPGNHQIVGSRAGYITATETLDARAGRHHELTIELQPNNTAGIAYERRWPKWLPWTVLSAGAVVGLASVPFEVQARRRFDQFDNEVAQLCPEGCFERDLPVETRDRRTSGRSRRVAAITGFAVGGTALAIGAAMAILNRPTVVTHPQIEVGASEDKVSVSVTVDF